MIRRAQSKAARVLALSVLSLGLAATSFAAQASARAAVMAVSGPAVPVTIVTATKSIRVTSSAPDVGALLEEEGIRLGRYDQVRPSLANRVVANGIVRVVRITKWIAVRRRTIAPPVIRRIDFALPPGKTKILARGVSGERQVEIRYSERDFEKIHARVVAQRVIRQPKARIVDEGVGEYAALEYFAKRGMQKMSYVAGSAMRMVATAYTAHCYGCSGITASGYPAGHGIVAVDPRVIPLGTRLYIPGYGPAIAGDTGGAILGNRIDLGFNSLHDAVEFGRRVITVYRLK
ncbi:MAG: 3D domain-containing protein [Vulcanimicrobiaceae bacterium]